MRRLACLIIAATASACSTSGSFSGHLESTGETGTWVIDHGACYNGTRDGFFGITVESTPEDGVNAKFVKDPVKGWSVINEADTCKTGHTGKCMAVIYTSDDCKTFDIGIALNPSAKSQQFSGDIALDCTTEHTHLWGTLTMDACRTP